MDLTARPDTRPRATAPVSPTRGSLRPLGLTDVAITGGFWAQRQRVNADATLPHIERWLEREGWTANFDLAAAGALPEGRRGPQFCDSEVYKYLEALAWEIGRSGDEVLDKRLRALVPRVLAAQEPDGYLNTAFGRPGQPARWSDLEWGHELYCIGHLVQAGIARERTRPGSDDGLFTAARRAADLVCDAFGPHGIDSVCGHPEIEPALAELARVTGEHRYLAQAALFVERRGDGRLRDIEWGRSYFQDDVAVRRSRVLHGHVVRAGYLAAGAVDVAVETGDTELLDALKQQWHNTIARRTYVTGGQGSHHQDETFGDDWELPPDRAYSETCAGIASVMFSWRLLLHSGDARYADLIERTLFNVVATSPSRAGTSFFYANTLHQRRPGPPAADGTASPRAASSLRAPWFPVSCCPPNVARTLASLQTYLATVDDEGLQLHQYAPCTIRTVLPAAGPVALEVDTGYPRDGLVRIRVTSDAPTAWTLSLRVPSWAAGASLVLRPVDGPALTQEAEPGVRRLRRSFRAGDVVELHLPLDPRVSTADPHIDAVRGCAVVERGPEVLCLESVDLNAASDGETDDVADVRLDPTHPPEVIDGEVIARLHRSTSTPRDWPYRPTDTPRAPGEPGEPGGRRESQDRELRVRLTPYHDWAERGPSTMRVWIPVLAERPAK